MCPLIGDGLLAAASNSDEHTTPSAAAPRPPRTVVARRSCGGRWRPGQAAAGRWRAGRAATYQWSKRIMEGWGRPVAAERAPRDIGCPAPTPPRIREMESAACDRRRRWGCGRRRRRRLRVASGAGGEWWARAAAWRFLGRHRDLARERGGSGF
jgi:hypothetical protein